MSKTDLCHSHQESWDALHSLAEALRHTPPAALAEHGMGCVFSTQSYGLRNVRFDQPILALVLEGTKRYAVQTATPAADDASTLAPAPALLLLPANVSLCVENIPAASGHYLAFFLSFAPSLLERAAQNGPTHLSQPGSEAAAPVAPPLAMDATLLSALRLLLHTALEQSTGGPSCPQLMQMQCEQMALLLALRGMGPCLFAHRDALVDEALRLVQQQPHLPWTLESLAQELRCGSRTLRRRLRQDGRTLRELLRHVRLHTALGMLQQQHCTVSEAAFSCGYDSPSRFSRRFKEYFGLLPSDLLRYGRAALDDTGAPLA